jgi:hypothetical protein
MQRSYIHICVPKALPRLPTIPADQRGLSTLSISDYFIAHLRQPRSAMGLMATSHNDVIPALSISRHHEQKASTEPLILAYLEI